MNTLSATSARTDFKNRLALALAGASLPARPAALAREFNLRAQGATVTTHAIRKWLMGEAYPTQERLHVLARWLGVSAQWLRFGEGPKEPMMAANEKGLIPHNEIVLLSDFRRLDEGSQAVVRDLVRSLLTHHTVRD